MAGAALTAGLVGASYLGTAKAINLAYRINPVTGLATEILLGWTCVASRNLVDESLAVIRALEQEDLVRARQRLSRIVGRDTQALSETEINRAVIETLAESACDGIVAPLVYMAIGGVPMAMAYKAVNTLDSMIGHADKQYFYFGKTAARLDDVANYLPSRLRPWPWRRLSDGQRNACHIRFTHLAARWRKAQEPECRSTGERDGRRATGSFRWR